MAGEGTPRLNGPFNSEESAKHKAIEYYHKDYVRDVKVIKRGNQYFISYKHLGYRRYGYDQK